MTRTDWELAGIRADPVIQTSDLAPEEVAPTLIGDRIVWDTWSEHPGQLAERMCVQDRDQMDPWTGEDTKIRAFNPDDWRMNCWFDSDRLTMPKPPVGAVRSASPDLLARFIALETAPDSAILRFASTFGPLNICGRGWPLHHTGSGSEWLKCPPHQGWGVHWEDVAAWRGHAARARAILSIAADLYHGRDGQVVDWDALVCWTPLPLFSAVMVHHLGGGPLVNASGWPLTEAADSNSWPDGVAISVHFLVKNDPNGVMVGHTSEFREMVLKEALDVWLTGGGVHPSIRWQAGRASIMLDGGSLYGTLGVQLLNAVTSTDGLASCAGCGAWFVGGRVGGKGRNRYCSTCGRRTAMRDASRRYRERKQPARAESI